MENCKKEECSCSVSKCLPSEEKMIQDYNGIYEYVRNNKRQKKGILLAILNPSKINEILIGWSICSNKDKFRKSVGLNISLGRSFSSQYDDIDNFINKIPFSIRNEMYYFIDRCRRYYKDKTFPKWSIAYLNDTKETLQ